MATKIKKAEKLNEHAAMANPNEVAYMVDMHIKDVVERINTTEI